MYLSQILNKILELAYASIKIMNLEVSQKSLDVYKAIACLIIKICIIQIHNFKTLHTLEESEYGKNRSLILFFIFEALHDHFAAQFC